MFSSDQFLTSALELGNYSPVSPLTKISFLHFFFACLLLVLLSLQQSNVKPLPSSLCLRNTQLVRSPVTSQCVSPGNRTWEKNAFKIHFAISPQSLAKIWQNHDVQIE